MGLQEEVGCRFQKSTCTNGFETGGGNGWPRWEKCQDTTWWLGQLGFSFQSYHRRWRAGWWKFPVRGRTRRLVSKERCLRWFIGRWRLAGLLPDSNPLSFEWSVGGFSDRRSSYWSADSIL